MKNIYTYGDDRSAAMGGSFPDDATSVSMPRRELEKLQERPDNVQPVHRQT